MASENSAPTGTPEAKKHEMGIMGVIGVAVGGGCLFIALLGVFNTAFDLNWALSVSGSDTPLPKHWDTVAGLAAFGLLLIGITFFGSFVTGKFKAAKGKPLVRVGILAAAFGLLFLVGRGLQIMALVGTYGSMLAYYATDGDLEDVKAELAHNPTPKELDDAMGRTAQYDNHEALLLLLEAGANFEDATNSEFKSCVLGSEVGVEYTRIAVEHGAKPENCPKSDELIWDIAAHRGDDAIDARRIELLAGAGWRVDIKPEDEARSALAEAQELKKAATILALQTAGAT